MMRKRTERKVEQTKLIAEGVSRRALPLSDPSDLDPLIERIGDATYVLLGEATHGTSEFYEWRAALSRRLIEERGFSFVGVEGDWPDCYRVNRYAKSYADSGDSARDVLHAFERWPTWMWANREVAEFAEWLRDHNRRLSPERQAGFYGLDVYSLWESMHAVVGYLESVDPALARAARAAYGCFEPYAEDAQQYARATAIVPTTCEREAVAVLGALRRKATEYSEDGRDAFFNAEQNALVAKNAELYYRTMVRGGPTSWNVRDSHMVETLERLMVHHGPAAKAIVWEHNTHIGDARFTDMARGGMFNVGQLVRQEHDADDAALVGFGTHRGTVVAGEEWGAPMRSTSRTRATCCCCSTGPMTAASRVSKSQSDIGRSAWCTTRATSTGATTSRRSCRDGTTPSSTSRRRSGWMRCTCPCWWMVSRRRRFRQACSCLLLAASGSVGIRALVGGGVGASAAGRLHASSRRAPGA
jgi:erythromycin esterase